MAKVSKKKRTTRRVSKKKTALKARRGSKVEIVIPIVQDYLAHEDEREPGDVVKEIMKKADMTQAGARTYLYNIKNRLQAGE